MPSYIFKVSLELGPNYQNNYLNIYWKLPQHDL